MVGGCTSQRKTYSWVQLRAHFAIESLSCDLLQKQYIYARMAAGLKIELGDWIGYPNHPFGFHRIESLPSYFLLCKMYVDFFDVIVHVSMFLLICVRHVINWMFVSIHHRLLVRNWVQPTQYSSNKDYTRLKDLTNNSCTSLFFSIFITKKIWRVHSRF